MRYPGRICPGRSVKGIAATATSDTIVMVPHHSIRISADRGGTFCDVHACVKYSMFCFKFSQATSFPEIILTRITRVTGKNSSLSSARPSFLPYNAHRNLIPVQYHRILPITKMPQQKASGVCWRLSLEMRYPEAKSLISPRSVGCSLYTSFAYPDWSHIIRLHPPVHNCRHQCAP